MKPKRDRPYCRASRRRPATRRYAPTRLTRPAIGRDALSAFRDDRAYPPPSAADQLAPLPSILMLASGADLETDLLSAKILERGARVIRVNVEDIPSRVHITYTFGEKGSECKLVEGRRETSLNTVAAAWAPSLGRGPIGLAFDGLPAGELALGGWAGALGDLARSMPCLWVNHPAAAQSASDGLLQIRIAAQVGLEVPRTVMTNDPAQLRALGSQCNGRVVARAVGHYRLGSRGYGASACGEPLAPEGLCSAGDVRMAPRICQEHIRERLLLRVFVVGPRVFTSRIPVEHGREPSGSPQPVFTAEHRLAPEVESRCRLLLRRLGLLFAAVDLALTLDGRHIFLSLDPAPLWRRTEEQTGHLISDALVELLIPYDERTSPGSKPGAPAAYG